MIQCDTEQCAHTEQHVHIMYTFSNREHSNKISKYVM